MSVASLRRVGRLALFRSSLATFSRYIHLESHPTTLYTVQFDDLVMILEKRFTRIIVYNGHSENGLVLAGH